MHDNGDTRSEMGKLLRLGTARGGGEREAMEQASAFGRRWPSSGGRTRDVEALAKHERHEVSGSCAGRP